MDRLRTPRRISRRDLLRFAGGGAAALAFAACSGDTAAPTPTPRPSLSRTPSPSPPGSPTPFPTFPASLERKIGQMVLVGFEGLTVADASTAARRVIGGDTGGLVLFNGGADVADNITSPTQVEALTAGLKALSYRPLIIATDQEGGAVSRLDERSGFLPTLSPQYLGDLDDIEVTRQSAGEMAQALAEAGVNLNLAPVVDLNVNPDNPIIGAFGRSFSADPDVVTRHARAFIEAMHERGVFCTLKHFPGHGSASADSHLGFVDVTDTWSQDELIPFQAIIDAGLADAVLTAHVFNANLDPDYPATLSHATITGLLRGQLGYDGVVLTDSMQMKAITDFYGFAEAVELAVQAGADIISVAGPTQDGRDSAAAAFGAIYDAVQAGRLTESRIDESFQRIIALKDRLIEQGIEPAPAIPD